MVIGETTVRPMDGAVEHPRMGLLRVHESMPWLRLRYTLTLIQWFYPLVHSKRFQISENKKTINHIGLSLFIIFRSLAIT
jgi:hypothetical protein